jgi:hypothetical protein
MKIIYEMCTDHLNYLKSSGIQENKEYICLSAVWNFLIRETRCYLLVNDKVVPCSIKGIIGNPDFKKPPH